MSVTPGCDVAPVGIRRLRRGLIAHIRAAERAAGSERAGSPAAARLELAVTDNRSTMITVRREPGRYRLRLHRMFVHAGPEIVAALGRYVARNERAASAELSAFIDAHQHHIDEHRSRAPRVTAAREPAAPVLLSRGQAHDLQSIFDALNARYFGGGIAARIAWASRRGHSARSLLLGSYAVEDRLIRIHPTLDRAIVPRFYVEWIVYHEMLHQKHPIPIVAGRRCFHTQEFRAEERLFDDYERAVRWEHQNQHRLLLY